MSDENSATVYENFQKTLMYDLLKKVTPLRWLKRAIERKIVNQRWELHGDINLRRIFDLVIKEFKPTSIVETGTYKGYTSGYLARKYPSIPIYTCEINKKFYLESRKYLARFKNVNQILGESSEALIGLIEKNVLGERPLFFLDAHWGDNWPLEREIEIIGKDVKSAVIFIDDFKVTDKRFKFDSYGPKECSLARVNPFINPKKRYNLLFPHYGSREAFRKGIPHSELTGYPVIFQEEEKLFKKLLEEEFVKRFFLDESKLMKIKYP